MAVEPAEEADFGDNQTSLIIPLRLIRGIKPKTKWRHQRFRTLPFLSATDTAVEELGPYA